MIGWINLHYLIFKGFSYEGICSFDMSGKFLIVVLEVTKVVYFKINDIEITTLYVTGDNIHGTNQLVYGKSYMCGNQCPGL